MNQSINQSTNEEVNEQDTEFQIGKGPLLTQLDHHFTEEEADAHDFPQLTRMWSLEARPTFHPLQQAEKKKKNPQQKGCSFRRKSDGKMQWNTAVKPRALHCNQKAQGYLLAVWPWAGDSNTLGLQSVKWELGEHTA